MPGVLLSQTDSDESEMTSKEKKARVKDRNIDAEGERSEEEDVHTPLLYVVINVPKVCTYYVQYVCMYVCMYCMYMYLYVFIYT